MTLRAKEYQIFAEKAALWSNSYAELQACMKAFSSLCRAVGTSFNEEKFVQLAEKHWQDKKGQYKSLS